MQQDDPSTNKIQRALDELKKKLQKEREEAETLTQHFTLRRDQIRPLEDSRLKKAEEELAAARQLLEEQRQANEKLVQQLAAGREAQRGLGGDNGAEAQRLKEELNSVRAQLQEQRSAAEGLIQQFAAERDESRARLAELEPRVFALEAELATARQELSEQQLAAEAAVESVSETIELLTAERDESRAQLAEVGQRIQVLQEESEAAQNLSREQRELALNVIRNLESERDEFRAQLNEQEARVRKLEGDLEAALAQRVEAMASGNHDAAPVASSAVGSSNGRPELWRMAVPLTLVLLSSDMLSSNLKSSPESREAIREIQLGGQKLLDLLRTIDWNKPSHEEATPQEIEHAEQSPAPPNGPFGSMTPA
jgi:chromosome segregation ATPase